MVKKDSITIPKKALLWIAPAIVITAIIIGKHRPGDLLLFWIGITIGFLVHRSLK